MCKEYSNPPPNDSDNKTKNNDIRNHHTTTTTIVEENDRNSFTGITLDDNPNMNHPTILLSPQQTQQQQQQQQPIRTTTTPDGTKIYHHDTTTTKTIRYLHNIRKWIDTTFSFCVEPAASLFTITIPTSTGTRTTKSLSRSMSLLFFVQSTIPIVILILFYLLVLPTEYYINRGYTIWFHWLSFGTIILSYLTHLFRKCFTTITTSTTTSTTSHSDDSIQQPHPPDAVVVHTKFCFTYFLYQFCAVQGTGITIGWYCALVHDYIIHNRWGHILFRNMPLCMKQYMVDPIDNHTVLTSVLPYNNHHHYYNDNKNTILTHQFMILMKVMSHLFDLLGHPILTIYFYYTLWNIFSYPINYNNNNNRNNKKQPMLNTNDTNKNNVNTTTKISSSSTTITKCSSSTTSDWFSHQVFTWSAIFSSILLSRIYSITHNYVHYNNGHFVHWFYYYGYEIYHIDTLDSWTMAYIGEGIFYILLITWKVNKNDFIQKIKQQTTTSRTNTTTNNKTGIQKE